MENEYNAAMIWQIALLLIAGGLFLFGLACFVFAVQRFLTIAIVEIKKQIASSLSTSAQSPFPGGMGFDLNKKMQEFWEKRLTPTDGGFDGYNEEEMFVREKVDELKDIGVLDAEQMNQDEMETFVKQALRDQGFAEKPKGE
jgi:predicted Rdx family selenoprotein